MNRIIASIAAAVTLAAAAPAAADQQTGRSATVSYADLDLGDAGDRAILNRRIAAATERVCGSYAGVSSEEAIAIDRCRAEARRTVARQLAERWGAAEFARR